MVRLHEAAEADRIRRQDELDAERSQASRNGLGQFATPYQLSTAITRYVVSKFPPPSSIRFADPAVGSGSFYSALLHEIPGDRVESAIGVEIDPGFATAATTTWGPLGLRVVEADFTAPMTRAGLTPPNLVLTNPPYVRHHHLSSEKKRQLQAAVLHEAGLRVSGLAGLYVYFLLMCTEWMEDGGVAAWLIPSEFMDVNYGAVLREYLSRRVTLLQVHRFDPHDVQFADALVSSAVVIFRKQRPDSHAAVTFSFGGTLDAPALTQSVSLSALTPGVKWSRFPVVEVEDLESGIRLGTLFRIRRGIATGANDFFVIPRIEVRARGISERFCRPILPSPRKLGETVIETDEDGYPRIEPQLALLDCDLDEDAIRSKFAGLWDYLSLAKDQGVLDRYLVRKRTPWYRQEQRPPPPFLCTYMGRGADDKRPFRFIWNKSQAVATNMYLMLYPKGILHQVVAEDSRLLGVVHTTLSEISGEALRAGGRVYGGGLHKMEPGELANMSAELLLRNIPDLRARLGEEAEQLALVPGTS